MKQKGLQALGGHRDKGDRSKKGGTSPVAPTLDGQQSGRGCAVTTVWINFPEVHSLSLAGWLTCCSNRTRICGPTDTALL